MVAHTCRYCGKPAAIVPVYSTRQVVGKVLIGYVHAECKAAHAEARARQNRVRKAKQWEKAGQLTFAAIEKGQPTWH